MCGGLVGGREGGGGGALGSFSSSCLSFIASMLYIRFSFIYCTGITYCTILTVVSDNIGLVWWKVCV